MSAAVRVPGRAALAGNPSDGYGGAVVAVCLDAVCAEVEPAARPDVPAGAEPLVRAAAARAGRPDAPLAVRTSIPREVGLAGSSAIVIGALLALGCGLRGEALAREALAAEVDAGMTAGLQDRLTQALGGCVAMDFAAGRFERLDVAVPPLVVAWRTDAARPSSVVHASLRERFESGDGGVIEGMRVLREHGLAAARALRAGDRAALGAAMDGSLEARASFVDLDPATAEMAAICRDHRAPVNQAGSGGAVVALAPPDPEPLRAALAAAGCGILLQP